MQDSENDNTSTVQYLVILILIRLTRVGLTPTLYEGKPE